MKISIRPFLVMFAVAALLYACDGSTGGASSTGATPADSTATKKPPVTVSANGSGLVGRWSKHEIEGRDEYTDTLLMRADGTFRTETTYRYLGATPNSSVDIVEGTWSVSGNGITMKAAGQIQVGIYTLSGPYLIFSNADGSHPDTVTRVP